MYKIWTKLSSHPFYSCRPGQEAGNIPFVEESGFGKYSGNPSEIATTVKSWLADPFMLKAMQVAALKASRPHATLDIAKDLSDMVLSEKQKQKAQSPQLESASA